MEADSWQPGNTVMSADANYQPDRDAGQNDYSGASLKKLFQEWGGHKSEAEPRQRLRDCEKVA